MPRTLPDPAHGTVEDQLAALDRAILEVNARVDRLPDALVAEIRRAMGYEEPSRPVRHLSVVREQS